MYGALVACLVIRSVFIVTWYVGMFETTADAVRDVKKRLPHALLVG